MDLATELRKMNIGMNRTDVENLFLKEMVEEDSDDILMEDSAYDMLISDSGDSLFGDSSSEDYLDDEDDELDGILGDDEDAELF